MVRLLVKGAHENDSFHYMCGSEASIGMIIRDVASIYALRRACLEVSELASREQSRDEPNGLYEETKKTYCTCGNPPLRASEDEISVDNKRKLCQILSCCSESDACVAIRELSDALDRVLLGISGENNQTTGNLRDGCAPIISHQQLASKFEIEDPRLWCCGKLLCVGDGREVLRDFVNVNDTTNLTVYLRSAKDGPPPRQSSIDQTTYRNLVAFYHKREEEVKQLRIQAEESRDRDHYLSAEWANPRKLKNSLIGNGGRISYSF